MQETYKIFSEQEIEYEILPENKPPAYTNSGYPYNQLDDRQFEVLVYYVFSEEIKQGKLVRFDNIALMQGVGEQGRDCVLYKSGQVVGIIQCKKYNSRISKPAVLKEILKFLLYYIKNPKLMNDLRNFVYYIVASGEFAGTSIELLNNFNKAVMSEPIAELTANVIKSYKALNDLQYDDIAEELNKFLAQIEVKYLTSIDLDLKVSGYSHLVSRFFSVQKIISHEDNEKIIQRVLSSINQQGMVEQLHTSFANKDFISATDKVNSIKRMLSTSDSYEIIPDIANPGCFKINPKLSSKNKTGTIKISSEVILTDDFNSLKDLFRKINHNQEPVALKTKKLEVKAGNELIEKFTDDIEEYEQTAIIELCASELEVIVTELDGDETERDQTNKLTIFPQPFPKPRQMYLETGGFGGTSINILLGLEKIEECAETNRVILSSPDTTENPITFRLVTEVPKIITTEANGNAQTICNDFELYPSENATAYHKVLVYNFLNEMKKNSDLVVRDYETGKEIFCAKGVNYNSKTDVRILKNLWEAIYKIETTFNVQLKLPGRITLEERKALYEIKQIIDKGKINSVNNCKWSFLFTKEQDRIELVHTIQSWKNKPFAFFQECGFEIYNIKLNLGNRILYFKFSEEDVQKMIDIIQSNKIGENFELDLTNSFILCVFPKFYGTEDLKQISIRENIDFFNNVL